MKGIVIKNTGSWYSVLTDEGTTVLCKIKGNFRLKDIRSTNPVAVGDRVSLSPNPSPSREGSGEHEVSSTVSELPITHMPLSKYLPATLFFFAAWGATYYVLITWTNSTVPLLDSFTNALSFVGMWALARKYIEQWFFWIVVDVVCCMLYVQKGIPFKAGLYGLYVVIAIAGYFKWKKLSTQSS